MRDALHDASSRSPARPPGEGVSNVSQKAAWASPQPGGPGGGGEPLLLVLPPDEEDAPAVDDDDPPDDAPLLPPPEDADVPLEPPEDWAPPSPPPGAPTDPKPPWAAPQAATSATRPMAAWARGCVMAGTLSLSSPRVRRDRSFDCKVGASRATPRQWQRLPQKRDLVDSLLAKHFARTVARPAPIRVGANRTARPAVRLAAHKKDWTRIRARAKSLRPRPALGPPRGASRANAARDDPCLRVSSPPRMHSTKSPASDVTARSAHAAVEPNGPGQSRAATPR